MRPMTSLGAPEIAAQDGEEVVADPGDYIVVPKAGPKGARRLDEECVGCRMPQGVDDAAMPIETDGEDREAAIPSVRLPEG